jgi:hypothetical protein
MDKINLHFFERDLINTVGIGSNAPPRTIRAKDLDGNNKRLTLLPDQSETPSYTVKYTQDGIILNVLPALPTASGLHVLTVSGGVLAWTATQDCD